MLATVYAGTTIGLEGVLIKVEVDVADRGFPTFSIVGLPNKAIEESKERVRTAIANTSFTMPDSRTVVNLAPADIPKEGSLFDLPIAVGILTAQRIFDKDKLKQSLFIGELSLNGNIRPVPGVLPIAIMAKENGIKTLYVPHASVVETSFITGIHVIPVPSLKDLALHMQDVVTIPAFVSECVTSTHQKQESDVDFCHVQGQEMAKRALEIAAAGFHNVHLTGPPGTGKTMLARAFTSILPSLEPVEVLEVAKIASITAPSSLLKSISRPFRSPHHSVSRAGMLGGGQKLTPGEISLAHRGVLFLDEFPEFPRSVLEGLRQPMEDGNITLSRARGQITFPARFLLVSASNPCPCGYLGHPRIACKCGRYQIDKYKKRVSGPIMDRIDLHVHTPPVEHSKLTSAKNGESSHSIRERIEAARKRQMKRLENTTVTTNAEMSSAHIRRACTLEQSATDLLNKASETLSLSARSYFKTIKVAQTIADLEGVSIIQKKHIAEALQFRSPRQ